LEAFTHDFIELVRHRTVRSKGCLSNKTALAIIFKLAELRPPRKAGGTATLTTSYRKSSSSEVR
jgi:hypothetical protein